MSDLGDKLVEIKRQKDEYILPENIRKNVTVYGVTGTLEAGSGGGDVKLFDTIEHMQEDENAQEGDLAVVYREELTNVTAESEFDSCIFPNTVVLDEAFTGSISGGFGATEQGVVFAATVEVSSSRFIFSDYVESEIIAQYTSQDGITYTRTDGGEELVEFGTTIKWESFFGPFNSIIGNFMKVNSDYYGGLYKYSLNVVDKDNIWFARMNDISFDYDGSSITNVQCSNLYYSSIISENIINAINYLKTTANINSNLIGVARKDDGKLLVLAMYSLDSSSYRDFGLNYMGYNVDKEYLGLITDWNSSNTKLHFWELDEETFEPISTEPTVLDAQLNTIKGYAGFGLKLQTIVLTYIFSNSDFSVSPCIVCGNSSKNTKKYISDVIDGSYMYRKYDRYKKIST